ncbi:biotin/lipoyl-binding protein [Brevibacterium sp. 91QC2O2]|uniref:acetyl/propionyl/methylcrotonyl-CoA carboxylase subunit alpha n=1 Tax=Brevibacterium TaxID=1696 RepID=UPI00211BA966|nr:MULTISPECIES: biotin carboxylase N-terminal domain-containing protein [unclassified Brevibacterium]MCQ9368506.1 biotin/lipoyl-binding protein [Brevibacterium sp. 91QC2O2]MCQ9385914.1 biotin/lipoyl-binding protein [Brevibacterium sp. 68QC2CO]
MVDLQDYSTDVIRRPFTRVLIANRGEIALRVIRACHDLGLKAIALYTSADAAADYVELADDAWLLPGTTAAETYLDIPTLVDLAQRAGAEAVHPGYGYLSESPDFAQAVIDADLVWVGPPPAAIARLGDKSGARAVAQRVGAPITRGSDGPVASAAEALSIAERIGYPVAVKAVYGGGGRGFRTAASAAELPEALASAAREAKSAFGRSECLIEQQIVKPRHVETQCMADGTGRVLVASTRDCTLQRRNQKVLEEAPAPHLSSEQLDTITRASQRILAEVGYAGAATCEFLLGSDGRLTFMEANARIQVEHTVTEEVTGVDLVTWQLRIAAGQTLPETFPTPRGHAIQFRINAENPAQNFFPATGTISRLREPAGPGVRMDSGVRQGTVVGTDFDPMLAKLIVTGPDRATALARARRALAEYALDGVATLLPLHRALLEAPAFTTDFTVDTKWLETDFMPGFTADKVAPGTAAPADETTDVVVEVDGHRLTVKVPSALLTSVSGTTVPARPTGLGGSRLRRRGSNRTDDASALTAPMQGTIVSVNVTDGDTVSAGDTLAVIEAMKMEQPLKATHDAVVASVGVSSGDTVKAGTPIVTFA